MIKVGDKLLIKDEVYVIQNESYSDNKVEAKCTSEFKFVEMEFDTALGYAFAYEKQRANEADRCNDELGRYIKLLKTDVAKAEKRADAAEAVIASIKSYLDDLWMDGNASEHEYAFNTLKHIEKLERGEA